jgi:hypothetical protein
VRRLGGVLVLLLGVARAEPGEAPHLAKVTPPAARVSVDEAVRTAVDFLVAHQNKDGSFGRAAHERTYQLWCDVPGGHQAFKAATTALCWLGLNDAPYQPEKSKQAQARCLQWLAKNARVRRARSVQFYNIWALGYGLRALGQALQKQAPGADPEAIRATMQGILKDLDTLQTVDGGWSYLDFRMPVRRKPMASNSFTTATVLVGLHEAREAGIAVPQKMIDRAVKYVWRTRTPTGNYTYSVNFRYGPNANINKAQGSSMRNQACNVALHLFDAENCGRDKLRLGLKQLEDNHRFAIAGVRRPRPHESWYSVSGYFYLYGQQYAALVLERVSQEDQKAFWPHVVKAVLKTRQHDGSFWDYPTYDYHKYYGTGYALIALSRCPKEIADRLKG